MDRIVKKPTYTKHSFFGDRYYNYKILEYREIEERAQQEGIRLIEAHTHTHLHHILRSVVKERVL